MGKIVQHCAEMGIDAKTAAALPLYFTNRSASTRAGLGQPISTEEKVALKAQLAEAGLLQGSSGTAGLSFRGLGDIADRLPADMLFVMRTMHLVADLHKSLGGMPAQRFKTYARAAAVGVWTSGSRLSGSKLRRPV